MTTSFKDGDRVRDKFKLPKPGDECVTGTVVGTPTHRKRRITVRWDVPSPIGVQLQVVDVLCLEKIDE